MSLTVACQARDQDKHTFDVNSLLYHKGKLYSGSDDGWIKIWSTDLVKEHEVQAHPCSVYSLAASDESLYSCSNDGTIKIWNLDTLQEIQTLNQDPDKEYFKMAYSGGRLFASDNHGIVHIYKDNKYQGSIEILSNAEDLVVTGPYLFTARDLDLVVAEMIFNGDKVQYGYKVQFMGRAPVTLIGDALFAFVTREGKEILLHQNGNDVKFKQVARITNGSEMIINAMSGAKWRNQELLFSGGWDKTVKMWKIRNHCPSEEARIEVDFVINSMTAAKEGSVYVGGGDGHLARIDVG